MNNEFNSGYIYIFKCIVGSHSDVCKISKTKNLNDSNSRLKQHGRTLYYGFTPYCDFMSGFPIATSFMVKDMDTCDLLVKERFSNRQFSSIEIYNVDYDDAILELYKLLKENNQLIKLIEDGISSYSFMDGNDESETDLVDTSKSTFVRVKQQLLNKYEDKLPEKVLILLKDKEEFKNNCLSHYRSGNYIEFPNDLILDLHFNKKSV